MLGSVFFVFLFFEISLWLFAPVEHPFADPILNRHLNLYPQTVVNFEPDGKIMPGISDHARFTINSFGFRSPRLQSIDKPVGVRRIFCIGGSTTECIYLDDQEVWTEQLNQRLQARMRPDVTVDVINAGYAGHSTREHITMLAQRVIPFDPDLVIVMAGFNDLQVQMARDYSPNREDERSRYTLYAGWIPKSKYLICSVSQLMRRVVLMRHGPGRRNVRGKFKQDLRGKWHEWMREKLAKLPIERLDDPNCFPYPEFEQNMRSLISICRANDISVLLLTQPAIYRSDLNEYEKSLLWFNLGGRHYSASDMALLLNRYNECTRRIAEQLDVPLIDLAAQLPRDTSVFYDDCHFNVSGSTAVAKSIAAASLNMLER